jgi:hypothetical protein
VTPTAEGKHRQVHDKLASDKENSFVEFETAADLKTAVEKLDGLEFKGQQVQCVADVSLRCSTRAY